MDKRVLTASEQALNAAAAQLQELQEKDKGKHDPKGGKDKGKHERKGGKDEASRAGGISLMAPRGSAAGWRPQAVWPPVQGEKLFSPGGSSLWLS